MGPVAFPARTPHLEGAIPCVLLPGRALRAAGGLAPAPSVGPSIRGGDPSSAVLASGAGRAHLEGPLDRHAPLPVAVVRATLAAALAPGDVPVAPSYVVLLAVPAASSVPVQAILGLPFGARVVARTAEVDGPAKKAITLSAVAKAKEA